jgi:hypothetical protein
MSIGKCSVSSPNCLRGSSPVHEPRTSFGLASGSLAPPPLTASLCRARRRAHTMTPPASPPAGRAHRRVRVALRSRAIRRMGGLGPSFLTGESWLILSASGFMNRLVETNVPQHCLVHALHDVSLRWNERQVHIAIMRRHSAPCEEVFGPADGLAPTRPCTSSASTNCDRTVAFVWH